MTLCFSTFLVKIFYGFVQFGCIGSVVKNSCESFINSNSIRLTIYNIIKNVKYFIFKNNCSGTQSLHTLSHIISDFFTFCTFSSSTSLLAGFAPVSSYINQNLKLISGSSVIIFFKPLLFVAFTSYTFYSNSSTFQVGVGRGREQVWTSLLATFAPIKVKKKIKKFFHEYYMDFIHQYLKLIYRPTGSL